MARLRVLFWRDPSSGDESMRGRSKAHQPIFHYHHIEDRIPTGGLRKTRFRGVARTELYALLVGAAYNLVRMSRLVAEPG